MPLQLNKVNYLSLNGKQQEIYNFQKLAGLLADYGFNCIKLADDWQGADFLAYHNDGEQTLKVQLKSRLHIGKKYIGKDLFVAFPVHGNWHLMEHDVLLELVQQHTNWLETESWHPEDGRYNSANPNRNLVEAIRMWRL